jgi:hypothetical protein
MAATIAQLHRVGPRQAGAERGSWPPAAVSSAAGAEDRFVGRLAAAGAAALLMALLLGLLVGEYLVLWGLLFAPWTHGAWGTMP